MVAMGLGPWTPHGKEAARRGATVEGEEARGERFSGAAPRRGSLSAHRFRGLQVHGYRHLTAIAVKLLTGRNKSLDRARRDDY